MKQQANQRFTKNVDIAVDDAFVGSVAACFNVVVNVVDIVLGVMVVAVVVFVDVVVDDCSGVVKHLFYVQHIKRLTFP